MWTTTGSGHMRRGGMLMESGRGGSAAPGRVEVDESYQKGLLESNRQRKCMTTIMG